MAKALALETTFEDWKPLALDAAIEHLARYGQISADDLHGECKNSTRKGRQGSMIRIWRRKTLRGAA